MRNYAVPAMRDEQQDWPVHVAEFIFTDNNIDTLVDIYLGACNSSGDVFTVTARQLHDDMAQLTKLLNAGQSLYFIK